MATMITAQVTKTDSGWQVEHPQWKGGASFLSHNDAEEYAKKLTTAIDFVDDPQGPIANLDVPISEQQRVVLIAAIKTEGTPTWVGRYANLPALGFDIKLGDPRRVHMLERIVAFNEKGYDVIHLANFSACHICWNKNIGWIKDNRDASVKTQAT